jgi:hypothetical protein
MKNEADVKKIVKKIITKYGEDIWYFMPPANGYGRSGIPDFMGTYKGMTFAIETKFGNNKPTSNQEREMNNLAYCGAKVWLVSDRNISVWEDEFNGWAALCS